MFVKKIEVTQIKYALTWFCRITLLGATSLMTYVVLLPQYNFSHWVPHAYLKRIGAPYSFQLWLDHNLDKLAHVIGATSILLLLYGAKLFFQKQAHLRLCLCVISTAFCVIGAELAQKWIERGFSFPDILFGVGGILIALILIKKTPLGVFLS